MYKTIILPRHALDKHRESTQKEMMRFLAGGCGGGGGGGGGTVAAVCETPEEDELQHTAHTAAADGSDCANGARGGSNCGSDTGGCRTWRRPSAATCYRREQQRVDCAQITAVSRREARP